MIRHVSDNLPQIVLRTWFFPCICGLSLFDDLAQPSVDSSFLISKVLPFLEQFFSFFKKGAFKSFNEC